MGMFPAPQRHPTADAARRQWFFGAQGYAPAVYLTTVSRRAALVSPV